ncbi:hypothetical protein DFH09DRAFT_1320091 [Mycena vulgaris]|nr:hypothetical protein DFH09DRAFT_1320091 [Mycena vulgaris]
MKSEYRDAERILLDIIRRKETRRPPVADTALDNLNLALVRTALGAEGHVVQAHLGMVRAQCATFVNWPHGVLMCDMHDADLALRDGGSALAARMVFERLLAQFSESGDDEEVLFVLERLADPSCGMYAGDEAPLRWAGVYFALARTSENTFTTMRALRCLAALSAAQGDDETALSVFQAALDGFTLMGVHEGRGQCLAGMAAIFTRREEVGRAVEALTLARAMFDRSGMARVVAGVDADLAALSER